MNVLDHESVPGSSSKYNKNLY